MGREPWSAWTGLLYPVAALWTLAEAPTTAGPFAAAMIVLGVGTWAMHFRWTDHTARLDHAGMMAVLGMLVVLPAPWWVALVAGAVGAGMAWWTALYSHEVTAFLAVLVVLGATGSDPFMAVVGLGFLLAGVAMIRGLEETDGTHAIWHLLTATGLATLSVAVL